MYSTHRANIMAFGLLTMLLALSCLRVQAADAPKPPVIFPLERTAYFIGETVPLALSGGGECKIGRREIRPRGGGNYI